MGQNLAGAAPAAAAPKKKRKRVEGSFDPSKAPYLHPDASVAKEMNLAASVSLFDGPADDDHFVT